MRRLAKYLVEILEANGVEVVFGIPGVHSVELYRALEGTGLRHVTPRHEQGAGFMADGYARVARKPGVCFVISGPGMTNIATAMGQAYADSIPMLVISTVNAVGELGSGRGYLHEMTDQRAAIAPVSAFSRTILAPSDLEPALARAFALFASARPRPVHIQIPVDVLSQETASLGPARRFRLPAAPAPAPEAIAEASDWLLAARRPLIIAGGGAVGGAQAVRALARRLGAPVLMTVNGRGILPAHDPLAVPVTGDSAGVAPMIGAADVILALGTELGPTDFADRLPVREQVAGRLIRVDLDPAGVMGAILPDLPILAEAGQAVQAILARLGDSLPAAEPGWGEARAASVRQAALEGMPEVLRAGHRLMSAIAAQAPDGIIVGDSCQPVYAGCTAFGALPPGHWFCSATGFGTLGYALPAAIGAAIAAPGGPVFAVIGDGGLQFTLAELGSATEAGTAIRLILWNNDGYAEIRRFMDERGIAPLGVDIFTPDFARICSAFGWRHDRATTFEDLHSWLATEAGGNQVLELDEAAFCASLLPAE